MAKKRVTKHKSVRPYEALHSPIGGIVHNVKSGSVWKSELPKPGDFVTIRWHSDEGEKLLTTHQVLLVDSEKTGDMWLRTHWKGWVTT